MTAQKDSFVSPSCTLSCAEKRYSQIEKEALAIIFSVKKFHQYLHGQNFSDHKPLQYLFKETNSIPVMASARIQHWAWILGAYNYSICHLPGSAIPHADALSRLPLANTYSSTPVPSEINHLISQLSTMTTSIVTATQIEAWTDCDPILSRVRRLILNGWTTSDIDTNLKPYFNRKHELSTHDGCVLWSSRVVVPPPGRHIILQQLRECHPGINRMKALARCYVWWPKIDQEIEEIVQNSHTCQIQMNRPMPPKVTPHPWEYPLKPWHCIDHAGPWTTFSNYY